MNKLTSFSAFAATMAIGSVSLASNCSGCYIDFDDNGQRDVADIALFFNHYFSGSTVSDVNADGVVDIADQVTYWSMYNASACPSPCDLNNDGSVNIADDVVFWAAWNAGSLRVDFNCDGKVDISDVVAYSNKCGL